MTLERSKRRDFLSLIFISKSISKKLLINVFYVLIKKKKENIKTYFRMMQGLVLGHTLKRG